MYKKRGSANYLLLLMLFFSLMLAKEKMIPILMGDIPFFVKIEEQYPLRKFLLSAYSPIYDLRSGPYEDSDFDYYQGANFDTILWVRAYDDALMQKVHAHRLKYLLDIRSIIDEEMLRGENNVSYTPPAVTESMLADVQHAVERYRDDPYLIGYWICDEPFPNAFDNIARVVQRIKAYDPDHFSLVNLNPYYPKDHDDEFDVGGDVYIEEFINKTHIKILSYDKYIFEQKDDEDTQEEFEAQEAVLRKSYYAQIERIRRHAMQHGLPFINIVQAIGTEYTQDQVDEDIYWRTPNDAEYRWLVYTSLTYGVHGLIWFHWESDWGVTGNPDSIRDRIYHSLQGLNSIVKSLGDVMVNLKSSHVYHSDDLNASASADGHYVTFSGDAEMLVGFFKDSRGAEKYMMVTNLSYREAVDTFATINIAVKKLEFFDPSQDRWQSVHCENSNSGCQFEINLTKGEGRLYRFERL